MYREWPFFQTLLSNMDMVLAKSNIAIASRYAELIEDTELREAIFPRLRAECCSLSSASTHCSTKIPCWRARSRTAFPTLIH
jgi:phosphoenolpyruvate carboxylase